MKKIKRVKVAFVDPVYCDDSNSLIRELILRGHKLFVHAPYAEEDGGKW
ncbi:MAG: hypothetical protein AABW80_02580 [Nanoarchaeota archaeon]